MKQSLLFLFILTVLGVLGLPVYGQTTVAFLDIQTNEPIVGAHITIGEQVLVTNQKGWVRFESIPTHWIFSHLQYGTIEATSDEIKRIFDERTVYLRSIENKLAPITVLATRSHSNQHLRPVDVEISDRIEHDAGAFLTQSPALAGIQKSGSYGMDPVYRGFKYEQLNIVIDGVQTALAACPNRMDPPTSQISLNQMERVEISSGPHSLRYGASFGGTLNFISQKPLWSSNPQFSTRFSSGVESNGSILRNEGALSYTNDRFYLSAFGSYSQGADYQAGNGQTIASSFARGNGGLSLHVLPTEAQQIELTITRNSARDVEFPALAMDLRSDDTWLFQTKHSMQIDHPILSEWNTSLFGTFVDHVMDNYERPTTGRMADGITQAQTDTYGGRTETSLKWNNAWAYIGADVKMEQVRGDRERTILMGPMMGRQFTDNIWQEGSIQKFGLFGEFHRHFDAFNLVSSLRIDHVRGSSNNPAVNTQALFDDFTAQDWNVSASVGLTRSWSEFYSTGIWIGRAARSASLAERYINLVPIGIDPYEMMGNPQLAPEVNYQLDITQSFTWASGSVGVTAFGAYLRDFISSEIDPSLSPRMRTAPGVRRFISIDEATMVGAEMDWTQQLGTIFSHDVAVAFTYGQNQVLNQPLPEIAPLDLRYRFQANVLHGTLRPSLTFRYVSPQSRTAAEFGEFRTPGFQTLDLNLNYQATRFLELKASVTNVFDEQFYEHLSRQVSSTPTPIFAPGRNLLFTASVRI